MPRGPHRAVSFCGGHCAEAVWQHKQKMQRIEDDYQTADSLCQVRRHERTNGRTGSGIIDGMYHEAFERTPFHILGYWVYRKRSMSK
jgi:hypothetical protein